MQDNSFQNQKTAADPNLSVWVSASAGTGKTTVLVNRLLRFFLNDIEPSKILCLTFTNTGAIEMQNRIYNKTKNWVVITDDELTAELQNIFDTNEKKLDITSDEFKNIFSKARGLFSKLIDSPIPLKIYTIHAFCQSVLKRFPIEANISPHFKTIQDTEIKILLNKAYKILVSNVKNNETLKDIDISKSFEYLMKIVPENEFDNLMNKIISDREHFFKLIKSKKYPVIDKELKEILFKDIENPLDDFINDENLFVKNIISHIKTDFINEFKDALNYDKTSSNAKKYLIYLNEFLSLTNEDEKVKKFYKYKSIFLTDKNTIRSSIITQKVKNTFNKIEYVINAEAIRIKKAVEFIEISKVYKATKAIIDIGLKLNEIYKDLKEKDGVMDFTDLILIVEELFSKPNISEWILYKLDGGISHVLIDEAQDTSPIQWKIVDVLTNEFWSVGRKENEIKTFFSVGDRKQSIFSFQGSNINLFEKYKENFKNKIEKSDFKFYELPLNRSFRSCKNILTTVDGVIKKATGVLIEGENITHTPNRIDNDGYIELLPLILPQEDDEKEIFKAPIQTTDNFDSSSIMADVIAKKIRYLLDNEYISDGKNSLRKIEPKDIMILIKQRKDADRLDSFLMKYNIPISGKDRIVLSDNIVIEDLISLLKFVLFNYDDLSLAEVLKSPLYNLTDDDLFCLCYERKDKNLFEMLSLNEKYKSIYDELLSLINLSKTSLPFEFFDYVLKGLNKYDNFILRFGSSITDVLKEFLNECLSYDNITFGKSLSDFYEWFSYSDVVIKRDMEQVQNTIRIMTVHGSKGLEAPVVFLYNANTVKQTSRDRIMWNNNFPIYKTSGFKDINSTTKDIYDDNASIEKEEFYRLLYVAMTRAKERLYISGIANSKGEEKKESWYSCIKDALINNPNHSKKNDDILSTFDDKYIDKEIISLGETSKSIEKNEIENPSKIENINLPKFIKEKYIDDSLKGKIINNINSPFDNFSNSIDKSIYRGNVIHKLLEYISNYNPENIEIAVDKYLEKTDVDDKSFIKQTVLNIYNNDKYNFIFSKNSLAEKEIIYTENLLTKTIRVDKIIFDKDNILIIDYKTDKKISDAVKSKYKDQLFKYKEQLSKIYTDKNIKTYILWVNDLILEEFI